MKNTIYLLWYSKRFRVISSSTIIALFGAFGMYIFLSSIGAFKGDDRPLAFVPQVMNSHGLEMPSVQVKSLNPSLKGLNEAMMNSSNDLLIRYVNGYIHTATNIVVSNDIITHDQKIEFLNDADANAGVKTLPWNAGFAVGLSYQGGAMSDPLLLDKMAYGILITWTGEKDPLAASTKLLGEKFPAQIRFPMAISHIHREMLSNIFLVDLEKSSLVDFRSVLLAVKDLPVDKDQLRKMNHAINHNVSYLTNYLSATSKVATEDLTNKKAYYLLNYYLAPDYTLYSIITRKMENSIATDSYRERVREARKQQEEEEGAKSRLQKERDQRRAIATGQISGENGPGQDTKNEVKQMLDRYKTN
jgi:hypothetical protein